MVLYGIIVYYGIFVVALPCDSVILVDLPCDSVIVLYLLYAVLCSIYWP